MLFRRNKMNTILTETLFREGLETGRKDFTSVIVEGNVDLFGLVLVDDVNLDGVIFKGDVNFNNAKIGSKLHFRNSTVRGEIFCGDDVALWLQCSSYFGPKGTPVHVNKSAIEKVLQTLKLILNILRPKVD